MTPSGPTLHVIKINDFPKMKIHYVLLDWWSKGVVFHVFGLGIDFWLRHTKMLHVGLPPLTPLHASTPRQLVHSSSLSQSSSSASPLPYSSTVNAANVTSGVTDCYNGFSLPLPYLHKPPSPSLPSYLYPHLHPWLLLLTPYLHFHFYYSSSPFLVFHGHHLRWCQASVASNWKLGSRSA